jgi:hypothetical protein
MGKYYDACREILAYIDENSDDVFRTRGAFSIRLGQMISLVEPDHPDDPRELEELRIAAKEILGIQLRA